MTGYFQAFELDERVTATGSLVTSIVAPLWLASHWAWVTISGDGCRCFGEATVTLGKTSSPSAVANFVIPSFIVRMASRPAIFHSPSVPSRGKPLPILNTGAQWHMLPQSYPNYKTVHRRFQTWCRDEVLRRVLTDVANELRDRGALDEEECFIDATFVMAKGGGLEIGATKRGKGMKIMAIVDRHGLPLSVSTHAANHHEVRLVQLCFDFYMIEAKPENLIGDRAYDSDPLDAELRKDGIEMIAPHRGNRSKPPTQDRRRLSRYMRRWLVERFFAWIQWQRRILIRWEYHAHNFLGFVQLACLVILFKRF